MFKNQVMEIVDAERPTVNWGRIDLLMPTGIQTYKIFLYIITLKIQRIYITREFTRDSSNRFR